MTHMYQPLFGNLKKPEADSDVLKQMRETGDKVKASISNPSPVVVPKNMVSPQLNNNPQLMLSSLDGLADLARKSNSQLGDFIDSNKKIIAIVIVLIILLVLAYLIYNQQKQRRAIRELKKKMLRMRAK